MADTVAAPATLEPYLPRLTATWARERPDERYRALDATLVSVDLSGFTALSERLAAKGRAGTEELILVISGVFEGLIGIAQRHGGDVLKFRGDALLMLFEGDQHEARACDATSEMQWFIETAGSTMSSVGPVDLRMAAGVYSGPCQFFLVQGSHRELISRGRRPRGRSSWRTPPKRARSCSAAALQRRSSLAGSAKSAKARTCSSRRAAGRLRGQARADSGAGRHGAGRLHAGPAA